MRVVPGALVSIAVLAGCFGPGQENWPAEVHLSEAEILEMNAYATTLLDGLQARSFAEAREVCGYILMDAEGALSHTPARGGTLESCDPGPLSPDIVASYHTHGAYHADYNNEIPSSEDLLGDFEVGIDGYVSTPSGRVWRISHDARRATKLCGPGCVRADPDDVPEMAGTIPQVLTLQDIATFEH